MIVTVDEYNLCRQQIKWKYKRNTIFLLQNFFTCLHTCQMIQLKTHVNNTNENVNLSNGTQTTTQTNNTTYNFIEICFNFFIQQFFFVFPAAFSFCYSFFFFGFVELLRVIYDCLIVLGKLSKYTQCIYLLVCYA